MFQELRSRSQLILEIISYTHRLSGPVEQFKAVARLTDGSDLHINEVWVDGELRKYAYYQVTPTGDVVQAGTTRRIIRGSARIPTIATGQAASLSHQCVCSRMLWIF